MTNVKLLSIVLSCSTLDQIDSCYNWIDGLSNVSDEQREILFELLLVKRDCYQTLEMGL
jgi:hypothetical protein